MDETGAERKPIARRRGPVVLRPLEYVFGPWTRENAMVWLRLLLVVLAIKWLFLDSYRVPTGSMEPTLHGQMSFVKDDRVAVNKLAYGVRFPMSSALLFPTSEPRRWDVVVFRSTEPPPPHTGPIDSLIHRFWPTNMVKRVVGLPGERIHIQDGVVYADGKPLALPKDMPPVEYTSIAPEDANSFVIEKGPDGQVRTVLRGNRMRYGVWEEDEYSVVPKDHYLLLGDNSGDSADGRYFGWVPRDHLLGRAYAIWWPFNRVRDLTGFSRTWWGLALLIGIPLLCVAVEVILKLVVRSWRVREHAPEFGLRRGERLRVNCLAARLRAPKEGELWIYTGPSGVENADAFGPRLGVVVSGDDGLYMENVERPIPGHFSLFGPVDRAILVGRAESVWWPLGRRRALGPNIGMSEEGNAKASYGKED